MVVLLDFFYIGFEEAALTFFPSFRTWRPLMGPFCAVFKTNMIGP